MDVITGEERNSLSEEKLLKYELLKCCAQYSLELCQALNTEGLEDQARSLQAMTVALKMK